MPDEGETRVNNGHLKQAQKRAVATRQRIKEQLQRFDRTPLIELFSDLVAAKPELERLVEFADQYPDKHVMMVAKLAAAAGIIEEKHVTHTHRFEEMSDMELRRYIREQEQRLAIPLHAEHVGDQPAEASQPQPSDAEEPQGGGVAPGRVRA